MVQNPRTTSENWENNKRWILDDIIETRTAIYKPENRYTVELRIRLDGGIEITEGGYWADGMADTPIGFNLSIGDVDTEDKSPDGLLHHETWWGRQDDPPQSDAESKALGRAGADIPAEGRGGAFGFREQPVEMTTANA